MLTCMRCAGRGEVQGEECPRCVGEGLCAAPPLVFEAPALDEEQRAAVESALTGPLARVVGSRAREVAFVVAGSLPAPAAAGDVRWRLEARGVAPEAADELGAAAVRALRELDRARRYRAPRWRRGA